MRRLLATAALWLGCAGFAAAAPAVWIESLTWVELRDRVAAGATTALVPIGGTEQNGPHMVLGKHNVRVRWLAERIAERLGNALVAPVVAYVPEGAVEPPAAHMRWPGTLTVSDAAFESMLESTARSLARAGFRDIVFLGDHGGYAASLERVAARAAANKGAAAPRVHALPEYYRTASSGFAKVLRERGFSDAQIGRHAGLADTALALAVDESLVRREVLHDAPRPGDGTDGDPRGATVELGRPALEQVLEVSVAAIRARVAGSRGRGQ